MRPPNRGLEARRLGPPLSHWREASRLSKPGQFGEPGRTGARCRPRRLRVGPEPQPFGQVTCARRKDSRGQLWRVQQPAEGQAQPEALLFLAPAAAAVIAFEDERDLRFPDAAAVIPDLDNDVHSGHRGIHGNLSRPGCRAVHDQIRQYLLELPLISLTFDIFVRQDGMQWYRGERRQGSQLLNDAADERGER